MEDQKIIEIIPKKDTKKRILILIIWALVIILAQVITPYFVRKHYESKGYTFLENVGFIHEGRYQDQILNPDIDAIFEKEALFYIDTTTIDENLFNLVFTDKDLFDIGMVNKYFSVEPISFYELEFLYGTPFNLEDEIVIGESVSLLLFDSLNSVGETIIIEDVTLTVSGVVKDFGSNMNYIYIPISQKDSLGVSIIYSLGFRVFNDEDLLEKLYERGGIDLVEYTVTYKNQREIQSTSRMIVSFSYLLLTLIFLGIINNMAAHEPTFRYTYFKGPQPPFIKSMIESFMILTFILLYMVILFIVMLSSSISFVMAIRFMIDHVNDYLKLLYVYLLPLLLYILRFIWVAIYQKLKAK